MISLREIPRGQLSMSCLRDLALKKDLDDKSITKRPSLFSACSISELSIPVLSLPAESSSTHRRAFLLPRNIHTRLHSSRSDEKSSYIFDGIQSRESLPLPLPLSLPRAKTFTEALARHVCWNFNWRSLPTRCCVLYLQKKLFAFPKEPQFFFASTRRANCFAKRRVYGESSAKRIPRPRRILGWQHLRHRTSNFPFPDLMGRRIICRREVVAHQPA